jgi:hypothetical protein
MEMRLGRKSFALLSRISCYSRQNRLGLLAPPTLRYHSSCKENNEAVGMAARMQKQDGVDISGRRVIT